MTDQIIYDVLILAVILTVISFLLPLSSRLKLPYTVLLAGVGVALGSLSLALGEQEGLGILGDFLSRVGSFRIPADAFLTIFLPILLFSGGLGIDVRSLLDAMAPVLVLAIVAVVICMLAVGYTVNALFGVPLLFCLLLGAVVAATDPTAVVAVFRDLGAPRRLSILVEGESLFNDAAAIALYALLLGILAGEAEPDVLSAGITVVVGFAGGVLTGYILAHVTILLFSLMRDLRAAKISLTVAAAYLSYLVGQEYLGVSGVVAVVTVALVIASAGKTRVTAEAWNALTEVWQQLGFWAASLILFLAALLIPRWVIGPELQELGMLAVLILAAFTARALVVFGLLPGLRFLGMGGRITTAHKIVILWGGLRGAVTLALALAVIEHPAVPEQAERFVVVLSTGFVFFTLFFNGISLRPLLRLLGLDRLSVTEQALRDRAMALSRQRVHERVAQVAGQYEFDAALLGRIPGPAPRPLLQEGAEDADEQSGDVEAETDDSAAEGESPFDGLITADDRLVIGLITLANQEEELYLKHLKERTISRRLASLGAVEAVRLADATKTDGPTGYETVAGAALIVGWNFRLALSLHRRFAWDAPLAAMLAERFEKLLVAQLIVRELRQFNNRSVAPLLGKATATQLGRILKRRADSLRQSLAALELQYPTYAESLRIRFLGRSALRFEEIDYHNMLQESLVSQEVFNDLNTDLRRRHELFDRRPPLDLGFQLADMVARVPIFKAVDRDRISAVVRLLRPRLAMPGERIVIAGQKADSMFFIAAGSVEVRISPKPVRLETGNFFGELGLLHRAPRSADVVAVGYCHLLVLESRDFNRLLRSFPDLRQEIEAVAEARLKTSV